MDNIITAMRVAAALEGRLLSDETIAQAKRFLQTETKPAQAAKPKCFHTSVRMNTGGQSYYYSCANCRPECKHEFSMLPNPGCTWSYRCVKCLTPGRRP